MTAKEIVINFDEEKSTSAVQERNEIKILCLDLTFYSTFTQFTCCCVFLFICYLTYGYFLELLFTPEAVKPISLYITLVQFFLTMCLSYVEALIRTPIQRK